MTGNIKWLKESSFLVGLIEKYKILHEARRMKNVLKDSVECLKE